MGYKPAGKSYFRIFIVLLFFFVSFLPAEEVAKFAWKGHVSGFDNTTLNPPLKTVAMSEYVYISNDIFENVEPDPCSIVFIIDNSQSNDQTDPQGQRYTAVKDLINYIYTKAPETKIGLVIFGSRLWFYGPDNRNLFVSVPKDQYHDGDGCHIPPLDLNKMYTGQAGGFSGGTVNYNKTGLEVLMMYLERRYRPTHQVNYPFESHFGALTNITRGFDGANQAHLYQTPALPKKRHFNIFFSDGLATCNVTSPEYPNLNDYVNGTVTPTTFTVFYNASSNDLAKLQQMTSNIKNNGYSESNPKYTDIINLTNWQTIKQKLIELFNKILTNTSTTPIEIIVNSSFATNWDSTGFAHQKMFPLQKGKTPFDMELTSHYKKDSLDDNGNIIFTIEKDTLLTYKFDVEVGPTNTIPDSIEMIWWGRDMDLFHNGNPVTITNSDMKNVEVRFEEYKVDTTYGYDVKEMALFVRSRKNGDLEELKFNPNTNYLDSKFKLEVNQTPINNDGTLQLASVDTIVLLFKNTFLPLDTIEKVIPFSDAFVGITEAVYFDNDANGHVDSMFIGVSGRNLDDIIVEFIAVLEDNLPSFRDLDITDHEIASGGVEVTVDEKSSEIRTYVTNEDIIAITDTIELDDDIFLLPCEVEIIDSMAPIIMEATFIDSVEAASRDELSVTFSEDIEDIEKEKPFKYYNIADSKTYDAVLSVISQNGTVGVFEVTSLSGVSQIKDGDSIRVHWIYDANVKDTLGNDQGNPKNIRREINVKVVEKGMVLEYGIYFDNDVDGFIDSIFVAVSGKKVENHVNDIKPLIKFPDFRSFTIDDFRYSTGGIAFDITEGNTTIITYITGNDIISIDVDTVFSDGESVVKSTVTPIDSLAPVIVRAHYVDSLKSTASDELQVVFSENPETITQSKPFSFYSNVQNTLYDVTLQRINQTANQVTFWVTAISGVAQIGRGDSIRIQWDIGTNVYDEIGNNQDHPKNRRVGLTIEKVPVKYDLIPKALIHDPEAKVILPDHFSAIPEISKILAKNSIGSNEYLGIAVIALVPDDMNKVTDDDSLSGTISIYDPLGNPVVLNELMGYDNVGKQLIYVWDGSNISGRDIGGSGYLAVMPCTFYHDRVKKWDYQKMKLVGAKK